MDAVQFFQDTTKKKYVKSVSAKDMSSVLCLGAGRKSRLGGGWNDYIKVGCYNQKYKSYGD